MVLKIYKYIYKCLEFYLLLLASFCEVIFNTNFSNLFNLLYICVGLVIHYYITLLTGQKVTSSNNEKLFINFFVLS